jgi:orotate phosphoribosyltransferase
VIDDVITTGGSTIKAVVALREAGLRVDSGICILDREEGGQENLAKEGVEMYSLWKKSDFLI